MKKRLACLFMSIMMLCTIMPTTFAATANDTQLPWREVVATENFDYAVDTTLTSGTLNGGTGWDSAWYRGAGNYDSSISENGANKYLKCDGSTIASNRKLANAIDTVNDGTYVVTFMIRESANETKTQNHKFGFVNSSNISLETTSPLFAGICYDTANEKYCYQLSVNGNTVYADVNYDFWSYWGKNMMIKVKIDVNADGVDKVSAKGWVPEKGDVEPDDWTMTVNSELSELTLDAVDYRISGGAAHLGALNIEKYNYEITYDNATLEEYNKLSSVTDEVEKAERIRVLTENGFAYDNFESYTAGGLSGNEFNGGAGFDGKWYYSGTTDSSVPGVNTRDDGNYIRNYYSSTPIMRDFANAIDTAKDGEYYFAFNMIDSGSTSTDYPDLHPAVGFADKNNVAGGQSIYAGICLDENAYYYRLGVGADTVLSAESFENAADIMGKVISFKLRLSIDADGDDTVYMKAWLASGEEPAEWTCVKTADLSGYALNQLMFTCSGTTAYLDNVHMEGYEPEALRSLYSKIDAADETALEAVKTEIGEYVNGLAKEDLTLKANNVTFLEEIPWREVVATENFDYAVNTTLTSGTLNGGTGWDSAWYRGAGSYDSSISENGANKYLKCDGSTIASNRKLTNAIDTTNDGTYVVTFMIRESASETKTQNHKFGFVDSSNISLETTSPLFAGICYDTANEKYCYQLSVNGNTVYADVNYDFWSYWGKNMMIKVKIDVNADGVDTVSAKGWVPEKGDVEPDDWTMTVNSELSELTLDAVDYRISGGAAHLGALNIEKYNYEITYDNATLEEYNKLSAVTDEVEKAERIKVLAENGFAYDDFESYTAGGLSGNEFNGGAGFDGKWYYSGTTDSSVPGVNTRDDGNYIRNYYSSTPIMRNFANAIDTAKDGEYYLAFNMIDSGSTATDYPDLHPAVGFADKDNAQNGQSIYAGICLDESTYYYRLGVGADTVLSTESFANAADIMGKVISFKLRLSIDADGDDTVYMKAWLASGTEPADWTCVKTADLSGYALNQLMFTCSGTTAYLDNVHMEGYEPEALRSLYSKIDAADETALEAVKTEIGEYVNGLAKEDLTLKANNKVFPEILPWKETVATENFDYAVGTKVSEGTMTGGTSWNGAWYRGVSGYDMEMKEYGLRADASTVTANRKLENAIDTKNDGRYIITFKLREQGAGTAKSETYKVGFLNSALPMSKDTPADIYAGYCYKAKDGADAYSYQLAVGDSVVYADVGYGHTTLYNNNIQMKMQITVDANGTDNVSAKAWIPANESEPTEWTMSIDADLSSLTLDAIDFRESGAMTCIDDIEIVKYNYLVKYDNATLEEYNKILALTDEEEKADRIKILAENGFAYDNFESYTAGGLSGNEFNGGAGFDGKWYYSGSADTSYPGVTEKDGKIYIRNYYKATPVMRDLTYGIDTAADGEYYLTFKMIDTGTNAELPDLHPAVGFADKSATANGQSIYAGICLDESTYRYRLGVGADTVLSTESFGKVADIMGKVINFKLRLSIDADGDDTVYMKAWLASGKEPAEWTCEKIADLSGYTLDQLMLTCSGTTAMVTDICMEGYAPEALRSLYTKIDNAKTETYQTVKAEVDGYVNGLAKDDMILKITDKRYTDATLEYYNEALSLADETEKAERISGLAVKGFLYDDYSDYTGALKANKDNWNSGAGFSSAWYNGDGGTMDDAIPGISVLDDGRKFIKNYYSKTPLKRDLTNAINTTKDGEYYLSFELYDGGSNVEYPAVNDKVGFGDKAASPTALGIYAGIRLTEENDYRFQLGVGEEIIYGEKTFSLDEVLRQIFKFKVRLSIDADGTDTVYMKAWAEGKTEPADWTCVKTTELSGYALNQLIYTTGTTGYFGKVYMEGYEPATLRTMYSKVAATTDETYQSVKSEVEDYLNGLAKDDMYKKVIDKAPKQYKNISFSFKDAQGNTLNKLSGDITTVCGEWIIENTLGSDYDVMPILAVYDTTTNILEKTAFAAGGKATVTAGGKTTVTVTLKGLSLSEGKAVRAFLWRADGSFIPFTKNAIIDFSNVVVPEFDQEVSIYVDRNAEDGGNGDINAPFAEIAQAQEYIRNYKLNYGYPNGGFTVYLRKGTYEINESVSFTEADGGLENVPVVYTSYPGEEAVLAGGKVLSLANDFKSVKNTDYAENITESVIDNVVYLNLNDYGITDYGTLPIIGHDTSNYSEYNISYSDKMPFNLIHNNATMNLARWPNEGYTTVTTVTDDGSADENRGFTIKGEIPSDKISKWVLSANDMHLHGYWKWNWSDLTVKASISADGTITGVNPSTYGVAEGQPFYVYNVLAELDAPNEWYLDRTTGILYFYPGAGADEVILATLQSAVLECEDLSNVTFKNLKINGSCENGITINSCENVSVINCVVSNTFKKGIGISGSAGCLVDSSTISQNGHGGVYVSGGNAKTLTPAGNIVSNNRIFSFALAGKCYSPGVSVNGVGNKVTGNVIYDSPHLAVYFSGNDNEISDNEIYDVLKETDDSGAIYAQLVKTYRGNAIKNNYIHTIASNTKGTKGNYAVYLDNMFDGTEVSDNVFESIKGDAVMINGGRDNTVTGNTCIDVSGSVVRLTAIGVADGYSYEVNDEFKAQVNLKSGIHTTEAYAKYPNLANILDDEPLRPKNNVIKNNICYNTADTRITDCDNEDLAQLNSDNTIENSQIVTQRPVVSE